MSGITTHVLDAAAGRPASGVSVRLELHTQERGWVALAERVTDADGRVGDLLPAGGRLDAGTYRLTFATGPYFEARGQAAFFPEAMVVFRITEPAQRHHVPLLVSPFAYTTYRGS